MEDSFDKPETRTADRRPPISHRGKNPSAFCISLGVPLLNAATRDARRVDQTLPESGQWRKR